MLFRDGHVFSTGVLRLIVIFILLSFAAAPVAAGGLSRPAAQETDPRPPDALAGSESYAQNCAPCHGINGQGDGPSAPQLEFPPTAFADRGAVADLSPAEFFEVTKNGRMERMMPPWGGRLDDRQIWDTVAYAWSLHTSAEEVARGKAVYDANCASCHGADGSGRPPMLDFTDFAATSAISQTAWTQVVANGRGDMPAFGGELAAADQQAVVEYVRSLSFGPIFRGPLEPGSAVITGTVTNGTTGEPMSELTVTLRIFEGTTLVENRETKTDAQGAYHFDQLPAQDNLAFAATVEYPTGFPYGTNIATFEPGQDALALPLTVYETTTEGAGVRAERVHYIIEFDSGQLLVAELLVFGFAGDRTYIGDGTGVLHIPVPPGAQDLAISDGEIGDRYLRTDEGFVDSLPLPPGEEARQILFRYTLPYTGHTASLVRSLPYPITNLNALVADIGAEVSSAQLPERNVRQTQNGQYITLSGQNLPPNQPVTVSFSNIPAGSSMAGAAGQTASGTDRAVLLILVGVVGLGAALLAAWPLLRRRVAPVPVTGAGNGWVRSTNDSGLPAGGREFLVDALARLDLAHQAGRIPDSDYREQRLRLKAQLSDLLRTERANEDRR